MARTMLHIATLRVCRVSPLPIRAHAGGARPRARAHGRAGGAVYGFIRLFGPHGISVVGVVGARVLKRKRQKSPG